MRILVVEDNTTYGQLLADRLGKSGFDVDVEFNAEGAQGAIDRLEYSAVLLDLGLPDRDGLLLLRRMRGAGLTMPIIAVTARGALNDKVAGLEAGADDYIVKPFAFDELLARLHALLRRTVQPCRGVIESGNVIVDIDRPLATVSGAVIFMRAREIEVLELLMKQPGKAVRREHLAQTLFGSCTEQNFRSLDVHVHRLRKALASAGANIGIHHIRGCGFLLLDQTAGLDTSAGALQ